METLLFHGALVVDGSGSPPLQADVAVAGGRIVAVDQRLRNLSGRVIDAAGLVLAPGFIDIHSHSDMTLPKYPLAESKAFQGVTTEVIGNCGLGLFPVAAGREDELASYLRLHEFTLPAEGLLWQDLNGYADYVDALGPGLNLAPLVGHAPLRLAAMGMDNREPAQDELALMERLLATALQQGAWGMSTGLIYPPGSYAATGELVALARILAAQGVLYASHIRNEGEGLHDALEEAIAIGRGSGVRVQVSHLKAMGRSNWGRAGETLARLAAARAEGVDVAADQYPYDASATSLTAVVPQWAHAGGVKLLLQRLADPELRPRLEAEIGREVERREGAAGIMVSNCRSEQNRRFSGRSVAEIAAFWECRPEAAIIRLLLEEQGEAGAIFFSMKEEDVATILADPLVAIGSDGHGLSVAGATGEATHPRSYGTFPRVLGRYVREEKLLSLAAAIHKMTGLPADRLGLKDRGLVRPGFAADLVLFDSERIADRADYADPHRYAAGVVHLLVNGVTVIRDGIHTGVRPGRVLRRGEA